MLDRLYRIHSSNLTHIILLVAAWIEQMSLSLAPESKLLGSSSLLWVLGHNANSDRRHLLYGY
jgi:hypothetical protein